MPVILVFLGILILMAAEALGVAVSGYVFLDIGFWDSWRAAWDKPLMLFVFAILTAIFQKGNN